jgi:hypothetical protein
LPATPTVVRLEFKERDTFGVITCCPAPTTDCPGAAVVALATVADVVAAVAVVVPFVFRVFRLCYSINCS